MGKHRLSKSDIKTLNARLASLKLELSKKDAVDILDTESGQSYLVNGKPWLFEQDGELVPHLKMLQERQVLPTVTVDMGAVKFVVNGADVMRPGITKIEEGIATGDMVTIIDETHGKPLAVGKALLGSEEMRNATEGKVIQNIHHIGDKRWNA